MVIVHCFTKLPRGFYSTNWTLQDGKKRYKKERKTHVTWVVPVTATTTTIELSALFLFALFYFSYSVFASKLSSSAATESFLIFVEFFVADMLLLLSNLLLLSGFFFSLLFVVAKLFRWKWWCFDFGCYLLMFYGICGMFGCRWRLFKDYTWWWFKVLFCYGDEGRWRFGGKFYSTEFFTQFHCSQFCK